MPLGQLPPEMREEIERLASGPKAPPKWISITGLAAIPSRAWFEWHSRRRRAPLPVELREYVIKRDRLICGLCGDSVERDDVHIDHVLPVSRGGTNALENLQVAHAICNLRKGAG